MQRRKVPVQLWTTTNVIALKVRDCGGWQLAINITFAEIDELKISISEKALLNFNISVNFIDVRSA